MKDRVLNLTGLNIFILCVILPSYNLQQLSILNCVHPSISSEPSVLPYMPEMQSSSACSKLWPLLLNPLEMYLFHRPSLLTLSWFKCCDTLLAVKTSAALRFCTALWHGRLVRFVLESSVCFLGLYAPSGRGSCLSCSKHQAQGLPRASNSSAASLSPAEVLATFSIMCRLVSNVCAIV